VLAAVLLAAGAGIALVNPSMLVSPHDAINEAVRIYAGYFAARNLALAILLLLLLALRARVALSSLMMVAGLIQFLDAVIDGTEGRWVIVPGVVVLGIIFLIGSARISGHPFWKIEAWRRD
jgi:hypothetical protein